MVTLRNSAQAQTHPAPLHDLEVLKQGSRTFLPWQNWYPGLNVAYCSEEKSLAVLLLHCDVTVVQGESQWSQTESWKYKSHEVLDNPNLIVPPSVAELIYRSWVGATGDVTVLKKISSSIDVGSRKGTELVKKLAWASLWQCLLNQKLTSSDEMEHLVNDLFGFLSTLDSNDYSLSAWGTDLKKPASICHEHALAEYLKVSFPTLAWMALESIYKKNGLPGSANKFWELYLSPPHEKFIGQLQLLDRSFLKAVYENWQAGSDPNTDMTQYSWRLLEHII